MALTDPKVKKALPEEKQYKLSDEKGLFLLVMPNGSKYWRMKYRFAGKEKMLSIGVYPEISLKQARAIRDDARVQLADNVDPSARKKEQRIAAFDAQELSFDSISAQWLNKTKGKWQKTHTARVEKILEKELSPYLGFKHIGEITAPELVHAIGKIEARGAYETARKARRIAGQVFRFGIAAGVCQYDIAASIKDTMTHTVVKHMAAITDPVELGRLIVAIDAYSGTFVVHQALRLSPILFQRPGEIRHMEWSEIDWKRKRWEIPADKMKMKVEHIVPLPSQAIEILKRSQQLHSNSKYVFPSARSIQRPISENAVRVALRTMGFDNETMTPHGFRATARTLLDEELGFRVDWIEQQLAHTVKDATGRAYNRTKHLEGRAQMMQKWADYLDELKAKALSKNVVDGDFRKRAEGE
ncbi:integrase [Oleiphilus sp. HI0130]|nr:integrase [Oleiphilus sp. HI0130]